MKRFLSAICVVLALAALALAPATAYASSPTEVSATYVLTSAVNLDVRQAGDNLILRQIETGILEGDITGPFTFERKIVIHSDGQLETEGFVTFGPGSVSGRSGSMTWRLVVTGSATTGAIQGRWTILSGTGDLANLRGQGTLEGIAFLAGTISAQVHFDPE